MIRALWFFFKVALLVAAAVWLANHPGHVTFVWQGYEVSTSMAVVIMAVLLIVVVSVVLYSIWRALVGVPGSLSLAHLTRRQRKGYMALTQGMMAVAAGDARNARKLAYKAEHLLKEPGLTLLLQAQAAQLTGDDNGASRYYAQMLERPEMSFLGLRGLIAQASKRGDDTQALLLVRRAQLLQPKADWVLNSLVDLEARAGHWTQALEALAKAGRQGAINPDKARRLRCVLLLGQAESQAGRNFIEDASTSARKAHELVPGFVPAALAYANLLLQTDRAKLAGKIIERVWRINPHPELVPLYIKAGGALAPLAEVKRLQRLASYNPEALESRLMVAAAAIRAQLWGVAHEQLGKAAGTASQRVYVLQAELASKESGDARRGQEWLAKVNSAPPEPVWQCTSCQTTAPVWTARCRHCGALGEIDWRAGAAAAQVNPLIGEQKPPLALTHFS